MTLMQMVYPDKEYDKLPGSWLNTELPEARPDRPEFELFGGGFEANH